MKKQVSTPNAPAAIGPYSQAIKAGNTIYVSGQLPIDPKTGAFPGNDIASQTKQSLENIKAILESEGYTMADIDLARTFDSDFWSKGKLPAINDIQISGKDAVDAKDKDNTLTEDAVPNVRVFVDSASDDQITVIVVDVQHDITAW